MKNNDRNIYSVFACTRGILFLGTPHHGSNLAVWDGLFKTLLKIFRQPNFDIVDALKPRSEVLWRIERDFQTMLRARKDEGESQIEIKCFFEELPVPGVGMVRIHLLLPNYRPGRRHLTN